MNRQVKYEYVKFHNFRFRLEDIAYYGIIPSGKEWKCKASSYINQTIYEIPFDTREEAEKFLQDFLEENQLIAPSEEPKKWDDPIVP